MNFLKGLLIFCLLVLQACHYKNLKEVPDGNSTGLGVAPIDFAFVMKEVIQTLRRLLPICKNRL